MKFKDEKVGKSVSQQIKRMKKQITSPPFVPPLHRVERGIKRRGIGETAVRTRGCTPVRNGGWGHPQPNEKILA